MKNIRVRVILLLVIINLLIAIVYFINKSINNINKDRVEQSFVYGHYCTFVWIDGDVAWMENDDTTTLTDSIVNVRRNEANKMLIKLSKYKK